MSPLLALPSLFGALLSLSVAVTLWKMRPGPAWRYGSALGVAVAWWCLGQTAWFLVPDVALRVPIAKAQYFGVALAPPLWLMTALAYLGRREWLTPGRRWMLVAIPLLTIVIAFTNDTHHLFWTRIIPEPERTDIAYGPWFVVHSTYSYATAGIGSLMLAARFAGSPLYRAQLAVVLLGPGMVMALNLIYLIGKAVMPLDPTPAAFAISCAGFAWALARHQFLEILPMARGVTFEGLSDALIVVDSEGRIVDTNPATENLLGVTPASLLGARLDTAIPGLDVAALSRHDALDLRTTNGKTLEVRRSGIGASATSTHGSVVILRDVTSERAMQGELVKAQEDLRRANQDLERLALTDSLTGLANRRDLMTHLDQEVARARRHGRPLSFIMADIDHFKQLNDAHGHAAGDLVLQGAGRLLLSQVRPGDLPARIGGEEFGVLLPDTSLNDACEVARRVCRALRATTHRISTDALVHITMSVGVATLDASDASGGALIERADAALYKAKSTGRDGIMRESASGFERVEE